MSIKTSSAREIDALLRDLTTGRDIQRETAVARLTVLGSRAVDRLAALVGSDASAEARQAALRALEAIEDHRSVAAVLGAIDDRESAVAQAAIGAARAKLKGTDGAEVLDRLTAVVLDHQRAEPLRLAAFEALADLQPSTLEPLRRALAADPRPAIRTAATAGHRAGRQPPRLPAPVALLEAAGEGRLPDDPAALRRALVDSGSSLPLTALLHIIDAVGRREALAPPQHRQDWTCARGTAHLVLARRGSRLALYDLRESLATGMPLPVEFLAALSLIGDQSCLETLAAAHAREEKERRDDWWRSHLAETFRAIVGRERLTRRHAVMKRIDARWPKTADALTRDSASRGRRLRQ